MKKSITLTIALAIAGKELFGGDLDPSSGTESSLFIALFILGAIGIFVLIFSSIRISKMKKEYKKIEQNSKELEEKQNELLSGMSDDIQKMVKQAIGSTNAIACKTESNEMNHELNNVLQTENQLLDIANDLIEFLHLKAKKVTISSNRYILDNLLNDITGFISKNFRITTLELTYKIDKSIPNELIGDTLKISKILYNLLDYSIRKGATKLLLHVNKAAGFQSENELTFSILSNLHIDVENDAFFFKTQYNEENSKYDFLGLFVAKELASLMNGELIARNDKAGKVEFIFSTTFLYPDEFTKKLPDESLLHKKTLIVENNGQYADALREMLEEYEHTVTTLKPKQFFENQDFIREYELIILDEKIFTASVIKSLEKLDKDKVKIISLSNFFNPLNAHYYTKVADHKLLKPTVRGTLKHLLEKTYLSKELQEVSHSLKSRTTSLKVYTDEFAETPDVSPETFALFKDYKLLIVEDDAINQKVILSVLRRSGMKIDIANNGEECITLLEKKNHYDIILMDINMPTMDGYTATRYLRNNSDYDSIPIIALTTLTSTDEVNKMFNTGMNGHLAKPFHKGNLFTAFDMFLISTDEELVYTKPKSDEVIEYNGLNTQQGITQVNDNEEFYKEILIEFLATYQESAAHFEKLINDFRYEQVRMYCLDIKGLSGLIGATELHTLMVEIHHQLVFKKFDTLGNYVKPFEETVSIVSESIKSYIES